MPFSTVSDVLVSIFGLPGVMLCLWDSRISYLNWNYQSCIFRPPPDTDDDDDNDNDNNNNNNPAPQLVP